MKALSIDVGSSSVRTGVVDERGAVSHQHQRRLSVTSHQPGEVELDPAEIAAVVLDLALGTLEEGGRCDAVGVTNQRATTIVFDPLTNEAVGPALSWQDLRTVLDCLNLQREGLRLAPNQPATKIKWLVDQSGRAAGQLRFATIETWIAWQLTRGSTFVSDRSNACVSGLIEQSALAWDERTVSLLGLDEAMLPRLVDTMGFYGAAIALPGAPPVTALVGDQPASLFGQSCVRQGTKITFGTGAMLDVIHDVAPNSMYRLASGCYPTSGAQPR